MERERNVKAVLSVQDSNFTSGMERAQRVAEALGMSIKDTEGKTSGFVNGMARAEQAAEELGIGIGSAGRGAQNFQGDASAAQRVADALGAELQDAGHQADGFSTDLTEAQRAADTMGNELREAGTHAGKFSDDLKKAQQGSDALSRVIQGSAKDTSTFKDQMLGMAAAIGVTTLISRSFDMVRESIGKAMDRMDVMDNFNRTMTLMTGSSDKASGALENLKGQVKGTAYGLDVAAKSTQGLVTSGMELGTATKYVGGWMDAVSTYGDGTNASLQNVMFQLGQMSSKGKANLGDLKSAMEAGIPVIKMYAEATGQSTEQVSDQISKGMISADQFMKVMDTAFRSGTKSFAAIEGAAKKAGGTWKGSFDNMGAAVTRGVLSIISAVEDARSAADLPGMKDAVAGFGKFMEGTLNGVAKVAGFVATHFETLSTVLITGVGAWTSYKAVMAIESRFRAVQNATKDAGLALEFLTGGQKNGITISTLYTNALKNEDMAERMRAAAKKLNIALDKDSAGGLSLLTGLTDKQKAAILAETGALSLKSVLMGVLSGKIKITTAAQLLWNMAMKANPIGLLIAAGTALVGILTFLNKKMTEQTKAQKEANEEAKDMADTNNRLVDSSKKLAASYDESKNGAKANADEAKRMVDGLKEIERSSMKAEEKQYLLGKAVGELNQKYPELQIELNETGTAIEGGTDAIYKQIEAMHEIAKTEAMKEYLSELYKNQIEIDAQAQKNQEQMKEMEANGSNVQKTWLGMGQKVSDGYGKLQESSAKLSEAQKSNQGMIDQVSKSLDIQTQKELDVVIAQDQKKKSLDELNRLYNVTTDEIIDFAKAHNLELDKAGAEVIRLAQKYKLSEDDVITAINKMGGRIEDFGKEHDEVLKDARDAVTEYVSEAVNGFSKIEQESTISLKKYLENIRENTKAVENWQTNLDAMIKMDFPSSMVSQIEQMGPAYAAQAQKWVNEIKKANGGAITAYEEMTPKAKKLMDQMYKEMGLAHEAGGKAAEAAIRAQDYTDAGSEQITEIVNGIVAEQPYLEGTELAMAKAAQDKYIEGILSKQKEIREATKKNKRATLEEFSGDELARLLNFASRTGMDGLIKGLIETQNGAITAAGKTRKDILAELSPAQLEALLNEAGKAGVSGLVKSLVDEMPKVKKAAKDNKEAVYKEFSAEELQANLTLASVKGIGGFVQGLIDTRGGLKNAAGQTQAEFLAQFDKDELAAFMKIASDAGMDGFINTLLAKKPEVKKGAKDTKKEFTDEFKPEELNKLLLDSSKAGIGGFVKGLVETRGGMKTASGQNRQEFVGQFDKDEIKDILAVAAKYGMDGYIETLLGYKPKSKDAGKQNKDSVKEGAKGLDADLKAEGDKGGAAYVQAVKGHGQAAEGAGNVIQDKTVAGAKGVTPAMQSTARSAIQAYRDTIYSNQNMATSAGTKTKSSTDEGLSGVDSLARARARGAINAYNDEIYNKQNSVTSAGTKTKTSTDSGLAGVEDKTQSRARAAMNAYKDQIYTMAYLAEKGGEHVKNRMNSGMDGLSGNMRSYGYNAIMGFKSGIDNNAQTIYNRAISLARTFTSKFRQELDINSPSGVFEGFGINTGQGFILGVDQMLPKVERIAGRMSEAAMMDTNAFKLGADLSGSSFSSAPARPAEFIFRIGDYSFRAMVDNISRVQDREIDFELAYT